MNHRAFEKVAKGFTSVPNGLIRTPELVSELKLMLIYLKSHDWGPLGCRPRQARIASDLGIDIRTVRRQLSRLVKLGFVSIVPRSAGFAQRYRLHLTAFEADTRARFISADEGADARLVEGAGALPMRASVPELSTPCCYDSATTTGRVQGAELGRVAEILASHGVNEPIRSELAATHSLEEVNEQIEWMRFRGKVRDHAAALVAALRGRWSEPPEVRASRERVEKDETLRERAQWARALVDSVSVDERAREASRAMPPVQRYAFWGRAAEMLGGKYGRAMHGDREFDAMQAKYALHLIGEELGLREGAGAE